MRTLLAALADIRRLAVPYFYGGDRWAGRLLLGSVIALELSIVALNVLINQWNARFYNAIEARDWSAFVHELTIFCVLAALFIAAAVYQLYLQQWLRIRWRKWLTEQYVGRWLRDAAHYRMRLTGDIADNPDQRIAEDLELFTERTITLGTGLLGAVVTLASFIVILWQLSAASAYPLFGIETIPGYLVWIALIYAVIGTWLAHLIGRALIRLNFNQQRYEADFRYHLVRIRENGEQVALLGGEQAERAGLGDRLGTLVENFRRIMSAQKRLTWFTAGYGQVSIIFPYIVVSPAYFAGTIPLGILTQTAAAFDQVQTSFSFFINAYSSLAEYRAVVQRLTGFERAIADSENLQAKSRIGRHETPKAITLDELRLRLPSGVPLVAADDIAIDAGESVLVTGRSGSGKSTLFRAIAGIWPYGEGRIAVGRNRSLLVLPQRPYLPFGRLDAALTYPVAPRDFSASDLSDVLRAVGLERLVERLQEEAPWPHVLSLGEQQRLSLARAILAKPDILLLDEATSALDEPAEESLYRLLQERLSAATIVSIGHRSTLAALHGRKLELQPGEQGDYRLRDAALA